MKPVAPYNDSEISGKHDLRKIVPGQGAQQRVRPFAALPKGLPRKGSVCGVANPRHSRAMAAVCALHPLPLRGNGHHEKIVNRLLKKKLGLARA
jgi:hypothetical protein